MSAPAREGPVLDEATLQRLRELDPGGRTGLLARLFHAYESSALRLLDQLAVARQQVDLPAIRHVTHTLKSSSASIGALHLSQLCAAAEVSARDAQTDGIDEQLDAMRTELDDVLKTIRHPPDPLA